jgi:integrase
LEGDKLHVVRAWNSKNGFGETKSAKHRVVPMAAELKRHLLAMKLRYEAEREFVLPHFEEWTGGVQAQVLRSFCEGIGITPVKFHDLRATFISRLLSQGGVARGRHGHRRPQPDQDHPGVPASGRAC